MIHSYQLNLGWRSIHNPFGNTKDFPWIRYDTVRRVLILGLWINEVCYSKELI